jgi:hypothetical protein
MASLNQGVNLNIMELSSNITVVVKFKKMNEWTLRVRIGSLILRFALWIMPFGVEIETDED